MAGHRRRRAGLALPSGGSLHATRLEPSLTILYLAALALWVLLMDHLGIPLDAPLLVPLPGGSMLAAPILTCVIALACAGLGISYVNGGRDPLHPGPLVLTIMLPTALVLLPYQWLYERDGCLFALVAAITTGTMLALTGLPHRMGAQQTMGRAFVAAALVACAAMPWLAARRADEGFWAFSPAETSDTTTAQGAGQEADSLASAWSETPIERRGELCEQYLTSALAASGQEGETLLVEPGPLGRVTRSGDVVTTTVATIASPDPTPLLEGLNRVVSRGTVPD